MNWLMGHLIGDYLLQNDWMALNKKKSTLACGIHCLIWTATVMVCTGWRAPVIGLILFATHFAQDRTNLVVWAMQHKGQMQFSQPPMAPWSIIVVDNVMHMTVLWLISVWLVR